MNQNPAGGSGTVTPPPAGATPPPPPAGEAPHDKILEVLTRIEEKIDRISTKVGA
ncbi:MAG: hypothetical protein M1524_02340 [Patescibacteria group bacterium]|nr:hypothetical protein [Patescibacteria group bacterium]